MTDDALLSLWHVTSPTIRVGTSHADPPGHTDVAVVGGGITGLTAAVLLSRAGQRVTLIEARTLGAVATGNTTAKLSLLQGSTYSSIRASSGDDAVQAYLDANREGQAWLIRELQLTPHAEAAMRYAPAVTYAVTADGAASIDAEADACRTAGLIVDSVRVTELPFPVTAAIRLDDQVLLHPMHVLAALAEELRSRGGTIVEDCRVTNYREENGHVDIETSRGDLDASALLIATGTPIRDKVVFSPRIVPSRSYAAAYEVDPERLPRGMFVSIDTPTRSLRPARGPDGSVVLVVGGGGHVTGREDDTSASIEELDVWTTHHFGRARRVTAWGAQDYRLSGGVPFAGRVPGHDRVYAATGYNKWGMTNAVAAAHAMTSELLGQPRAWAKTLIEQFGHASETIETVSSVAGHMVNDWARAETTPASAAQDLQDGSGVVVREGLAPVAVSRVGDEVCRVSGVCTHMGGILNWNELERSWDCPLHGSRFSRNGEVLEGPAVEALDQRDN